MRDDDDAEREHADKQQADAGVIGESPAALQHGDGGAHRDGAERATENGRQSQQGGQCNPGEHPVTDCFSKERHPADDHPGADDTANGSGEHSAEECAHEEFGAEGIAEPSHRMRLYTLTRMIINCYSGAMGSRSVAIAARSLCFAYGKEDVLSDVSIELDFGQLLAIRGPNGSGKSTLIELLAGVRKPSRGDIQRFGSVSLVVQRPRVSDALPLTVRDAVEIGTWSRERRMPRRRRGAAVDFAIARVELAGFENRPLASLSGGQRQRALLAQGIVSEPEILLLDEPTAGLDARSRDRTAIILTEEAARGAAVVHVTHGDQHDRELSVHLHRGHIVNRDHRLYKVTNDTDDGARS
mgnify:CR=1 FL=1